MNFEFIFNGFKKKIIFYFSILLVLTSVLIELMGGFKKADNTFFDVMLRYASEPKASEEIVFLDIDDESLDAVGSWPWTRDILADVVISMKELGASDITFDIEYLSPSQHGIDPNTIAEIPNLLTESKETVTTVMNDLANAVAEGNIQPEHLVEMNDNVVNYNILPTFNELNNALGSISRDNDDYFGRALQFFGSSWLTVNYMNVITTKEQDIEYVKDRFLLDNVKDDENLIYKTNRYTFSLQPEMTEGFSPAQDILVQRAEGVGFTNVVVDSDGIRRRIELLYQKDGKYLPQLVFAPLLNRIDVQSIERNKKHIILKDVQLSKDSPRKNISIPLDRNGYMLINWQHKTYDESFKHIPIIAILNLSDTEKRIIACLDWLYNECYLLSSDGSWLSYYTESEKLLNDYHELKNYKKYLLSKCDGFNTDSSPVNDIITQDEYDAYFNARKTFFSDCENFIKGNSLQQIEARLEELLQEGYESEDIEAFYIAVADVFDALYGNVTVYQEDFEQFSNIAQNAFCIVGNKSTGNTDMGTTPFASRYPNVGTHANLYNTIIQQDFIYPLTWEYSFVFASLFLLLYSWFTKTRKNRIRSAIGISAIIVIPLTSFLLMKIWSVFLPISAAFAVVFIGFIADMIFRFLNTEHDRKFLKQAFSTYLLEDVVEDIVANPEKLALGGTEKEMTALFTDIKGFSSISEKTTPQQLVSVLNKYLTSMSDLILEEKGTIDKYIG
ncbi:MAG: CHASE2 domain-containing protein, partial [Spirochaetaceae bacterium]|nr:CHASE2 domain-containing protein [Spirochaetaceae bacterium]